MEPLRCASGEYIALKYHVMPKMSQIRLKSDKVLKTVNFEHLLRMTYSDFRDRHAHSQKQRICSFKNGPNHLTSLSGPIFMIV